MKVAEIVCKHLDDLGLLNPYIEAKAAALIADRKKEAALDEIRNEVTMNAEDWQELHARLEHLARERAKAP